MDRVRAIERVVKLAEVTRERGATRSEEEAAQGRARRLIVKHGLTLPEVQAAADAEARRRAPAPRPVVPPMWPQPGMVPWGANTTGGPGTMNAPPGGFQVFVRFG